MKTTPQTVLDTELKPGQSVMAIINAGEDYIAPGVAKILRTERAPGDTRITWDRSNPQEVMAAQRQFDFLKREKGFMAYRMKGEDRGEILQGFDPDAERIIFAPPMRGGRSVMPTTWQFQTAATGGTTPVQYLLFNGDGSATTVTARVNYNTLNSWLSDNSFSTVAPSADPPAPEYIGPLGEQSYGEFLEQQRERRLAREVAELARAALAQERARALLLSHLSPAQKQEFESYQQFRVESADGSREYVIRHGRVQNILLTSRTTGRVVVLCIHPEIECPDEDTMLCQKLMIEANEQELWRTANKRLVAHGVDPLSGIPKVVSTF